MRPLAVDRAEEHAHYDRSDSTFSRGAREIALPVRDRAPRSRGCASAPVARGRGRRRSPAGHGAAQSLWPCPRSAPTRGRRAFDRWPRRRARPPARRSAAHRKETRTGRPKALGNLDRPEVHERDAEELGLLVRAGGRLAGRDTCGAGQSRVAQRPPPLDPGFGPVRGCRVNLSGPRPPRALRTGSATGLSARKRTSGWLTRVKTRSQHAISGSDLDRAR
jgi:hypothetical protein